MTEEIINALTHISDLKVIARTSSFIFKDKHEDMRDIGRKLNVEHLLEGSVRQAGNKIRITAQLVKVSDGSHIWSGKYDRTMEDIFDIQDEISLSIVEKLKVKLLGGESKKVKKKGTKNVEAYKLYLLGQFHQQFWDANETQKSIKYLKKALEIDPNYALAYVGISFAYLQLGGYAEQIPKNAFPEAKKNLKKAFQIDDDLAEAYVTKAEILRDYELDMKNAEYNYRKAIEINPGYLHAHLNYGHYLSLFGRIEECTQEIEISMEIDPLSYSSYMVNGWSYYGVGLYEKAIELLEKASKLGPDYFLPYSGMGFSYYELGDYQKVYELAQKCQSVQYNANQMMNPMALGHCISLLVLSGHKDEAQKLLKELHLRSKENGASGSLALSYTSFGDTDKALYWLQKTKEERHKTIIYIKWPWMKNLQKEPKYTDLLKEIGLSK
jgi:serine/threonine-protein kinase